jgi:ribosomal protein S18 acetylase RimI-like enzyme
VAEVRLRPMRDDELPAHIERIRAEYAEDAERDGFARVELNLWGGNERARSLYRSLGYRDLAVHMGKDLDART